MGVFYFAYGSNINRIQMQQRCPKSKLLKLGTLKGYRLIINNRGLGTIIKEPGKEVPGAIWELHPQEESILDRYEGHQNGLYDKCYRKVSVKSQKQHINCLVYIDHTNQGLGYPVPGYLEKIIEGADELEMPSDHLGILQSWPRKEQFQAFNRYMNQIKSGMGFKEKITDYKDEIAEHIKKERDKVLLETMDDFQERIFDSNEKISTEEFESMMISIIYYRAESIADRYLRSDLSESIIDYYCLEKFLDNVNELRKKASISEYIKSKYSDNDQEIFRTELCGIGVIITADPTREHHPEDRVIYTEYAHMLEKLWEEIFSGTPKDAQIGTLFIEQFADGIEDYLKGKNHKNIIPAILSMVETKLMDMKNEKKMENMQDIFNKI